MSPDEARFEGSVPQDYDALLGPMLFEPYAGELASRFAPSSGHAALEVACGTGRLTRHLLERLPADGRLVATDLFEPMLAQARVRLAPDPRLSWKIADACALPFEAGTFHWVLCQFGLMFPPDKPLAVREAMRVLRPGGRYLFNVWDSLENNELSQVAHVTVNQFFPEDPISFFEELPFSLYRPEELRGWLAQAGFRDVAVVAVERTSRNSSARQAATALLRGTPISGIIKERGTVPLETVVSALEQAITKLKGPGEVAGGMRAWVASAQKS